MKYEARLHHNIDPELSQTDCRFNKESKYLIF